MKLENLLIKFYFLVHGKLHLPGAGWLIRKMVPLLPGLRAYPFKIDGVGTAILDFSDLAAFAFLNFSLGEYGGDGHLFHYMGKFLLPGSVLWDVGANVGYLSSYFAHPRHKLRAIHAFEPTAFPLKTLRSLFQNHPTVHVHEIGLGDKDGIFKIKTCAGGSQNSSLIRNDLENNPFTEITVRRGDGFQKDLNLAPPDVLKIDVEGFEPNVFAGLTQTISENHPVIFYEHIWLNDDQVRSLTPQGYGLYFILDDGSITAEFNLRKKGHDAVLVPKEKKNSMFA